MQLWMQVLIRSLSLFILIIFLARILGKRNIARGPPYRFIIYHVLAIIAALISVNVIPNLVNGLIAIGVWVIFSIAVDYLSMKSKWFHDLIHGKETVLIKHGKIMEENLQKERLTGEELLRELRYKDAFNLADVEFAVLENTGDINVFLKSDKKPVTPHDLSIKVAPQAEPQTVILDGNILNEPLASLGLNREWLCIQLENMGVSLDNVFLGQVDSSGDLYLDLLTMPSSSRSRKSRKWFMPILKIQANLMTFALETKKRSKAMYTKMRKIKGVNEKLEPYLLR